jgi:hypothetical protein
VGFAMASFFLVSTSFFLGEGGFEGFGTYGYLLLYHANAVASKTRRAAPPYDDNDMRVAKSGLLGGEGGNTIGGGDFGGLGGLGEGCGGGRGSGGGGLEGGGGGGEGGGGGNGINRVPQSAQSDPGPQSTNESSSQILSKT